MSTTPSAPPPTPPAPAPAPREQNEITIYSHSNLFYWWPVWAVSGLLAILTYVDRHFMVVVPSHSTAMKLESGEGRYLVEDRGVVKPVPEPLAGREAVVLPKGRELLPRDPREDLNDPNETYPHQPRLHCTHRAGYGVVFAAVLLLVIVITNVPLRGMWSVVVIITVILVSIIFAAYGVWETILRHLSLIDIRINMGGYILLALVLFGIWLITLMFFDRQMYMVFTPGQFKVCTEIGGGEKVYDTTGLHLEKQRSDLFRHWILGLGSGDLIVRTAGAGSEHIDLQNVLFIGKKVRMIEEMLQRRKVIETK